MFKFCQQCCYERKRAQNNKVEKQLKRVVVQESAIFERVQQPTTQHQSFRYVRKEIALEQELSNFLFSLSPPKSIATALPTDAVAFLVWKDRARRTRVHQLDCQGCAPCQCPLRLAHGRVDSLIGNLRSIFAENGRGAEWQPLMGIGNPAADRSVKQYLANVHAQIRECPSSEPSKIYILARDQAVFKSLFFCSRSGCRFVRLKSG